MVPARSGGALSPGIILTAVITGLVISAIPTVRFGARMFFIRSRAGEYALSSQLCGDRIYDTDNLPLAVIPFSPFVSSIGLLTQQAITRGVRLFMAALFACWWHGSGTHATVLQYPFTSE